MAKFAKLVAKFGFINQPEAKRFGPHLCVDHTLTLTCVCRPPESVLQQVALPFPPGEVTRLCRVTDNTGTWLALRQVQEKLIGKQLPFQTYKNHIKKYAVRTRAASVKEVGYLAANGAIKKRAKSVSCLEIQSLCDLIDNSLGDKALLLSIANIPALPAVDDGHHLQLAADQGNTTQLDLSIAKLVH